MKTVELELLDIDPTINVRILKAFTEVRAIAHRKSSSQRREENKTKQSDNELKILSPASTSLLQLQDYMIKKSNKALKILDNDDLEVVRKRKGNVITFTIQYKKSIDVLVDDWRIVEWFTINRVELLC